MDKVFKIGQGEDTGEVAITGTYQLQIVGTGSVSVLKSVDRGVSYYPLTDDAGEGVGYEGDGALYNSEISNGCSSVRFKFVCTTGDIEVKLVK